MLRITKFLYSLSPTHVVDAELNGGENQQVVVSEYSSKVNCVKMIRRLTRVRYRNVRLSSKRVRPSSEWRHRWL